MGLEQDSTHVPKYTQDGDGGRKEIQMKWYNDKNDLSCSMVELPNNLHLIRDFIDSYDMEV